jgi:hypothetical protein
MSRMTSLFGRLSLAALLGGGASPAAAEDFEFSVPVQLSNLDAAFTKGTVECEVSGVVQRSASGAGQLGSAANGYLGWGQASFPIAQGKFNNTVVVKFNVPRPTIPSDGRSWRCTLSLISAGRDYQLCLEAPATGSGMPVGIPLQAWMKLDEKALRACIHGTIAPPK